GLAAFTPPPPAAPSAVTGSATAVTQSSASVSGEVNPNGAQVTDCEFEYGTSTAYGSRAPCAAAPGSGRSEVAVSASLPALSAGVTYHFRVVATNAIATSYGADATFTTASSGASETTGSSPQPATPQPPAPQLTQPAPEPAGAGDQPAAAAQNAEQVVAASKEQKAVTVPVAKLLASTLSVGRSGTLLARVRCVAAQTRCIGTLTLRASDADKRAGGPRGAGAVLASAAFSIAGGHVSAVRLRLSATARALLAGAHRLRLQATIRARDPAGADYSARVTVIVRDA
ncbi:MAG TPA: hypothetical protein VKV16_06300, partial [Solirubrobacteraceae bacterium]|nr:hypothetical protein [Solirubrobacteraceae bacterium]